MQGFNFGNQEVYSVESVQGTRLKANQIHDVFVSSVESRIIQTHNNGDKRVVEIVFSDENGRTITDTIWEPTSTERKVNERDGKKTIQASPYDLFMFRVRLYAKVFAPKLYDMISNNKMPAIPNWDKMCDVLVASFKEGVTSKKMFKLKVIDKQSADGKFYPELPKYFVRCYERDGKVQLFISDRFIGNEGEVSFSEYELKRIKERESVRPTSPDSLIPSMPDGISENAIPGKPASAPTSSTDDLDDFLRELV